MEVPTPAIRKTSTNACGIAGSPRGVYVVGGAAMALAYGRGDVTPDIDVLASHRAVAEQARAMAGRARPD